MNKNELSPYKEYFETGIDWIGNLPFNWKVAKNSILFREIVDTGHSELELLSILQNQGIVKQSSTGRKIRKAEENQSYKKICKGDIGYNLMNAFMGAIGASKYEGIISPAYAVCRPRIDLNVWYYNYLFRTDLYKSEFNKNSYGIMYERNRLYFDRFKNIYAILPPRSEQDQIVRYLDKQVAKINKFIRTKKREIELVRELIDSETDRIINEESTKWYRFKNIVDLGRNEVVRIDEQEYIPIGLYNRGRGIFHKSNTLGTDLGDSIFYEVREDYLVFSGQFAWEGAVAVTTCEDVGCIASHRYHMLKGKANIATTKFLWAFFVSKYGDHLLNLNSRGAAGRNRPLNIDYLLKEKVPVPEIEKQAMICRLVEDYQALKIEILKYTGLLSEYKNSLISDAVTGKVDIRNIFIDDAEDEIIEDIEYEEDLVDEESLEEEDGDE